MTTKKSSHLSLKDRLSRLTYQEACKLLGKNGRRLIQAGGTYEIDVNQGVYLGNDLLRINLPEAIVTITLMGTVRKRLHFNCDAMLTAPNYQSRCSLILKN